MFARRADPVQVLSRLRAGPATPATLARTLSLTPVETNDALRWGQQSGLLAPMSLDGEPGPAYAVTERGRAFLDNREQLEQGLRRATQDDGRISADELVDVYAGWSRGRGPVPVDRLRAVVGTVQRVRRALAALVVLAMVGVVAVTLLR